VWDVGLEQGVYVGASSLKYQVWCGMPYDRAR
jgi:hypothetical protein